MANQRTPNRIVTASLDLFNRFGVGRVTVSSVASEIGISPGNLAYHFPGKQFILYRLIDDLEFEASEVLDNAHDLGAAQSARYLVRQFQLMWRYRFFFDLAGHSSENDTKISAGYQRIRTMIQNRSIERSESAVACGAIPVFEPPSSPVILAENLWAVWVYSLARSRFGSSRDIDDETAVLNCCLHHLNLIRPQANGRYLRGVEAVAREILAREVSTIGIS